MPAHGIMFHHFHGGRHPKGQGAISAADLRRIIRHVGRDCILPAETWMARAAARTLGDSDICFTFDDALRCQYDVAFPVLVEAGITGFWFVYSSVFEGNIEMLEVFRHFRTTCFPTIDEFYEAFFAAVLKEFPDRYRAGMAGFVPEAHLKESSFYTRNDRIFRYLRDDVLGAKDYGEVMRDMMALADYDSATFAGDLWMTDTNLKNLRSAGHIVGMHSYTHPTRLAELPAAAQVEEYRRNFAHLERVLGGPPVSMSHPCNSYDAGTLRILRAMGIEIGFRANMEHLVPPSRLEFPRQDHAIVMKEMTT